MIYLFAVSWFKWIICWIVRISALTGHFNIFLQQNFALCRAFFPFPCMYTWLILHMCWSVRMRSLKFLLMIFFWGLLLDFCVVIPINQPNMHLLWMPQSYSLSLCQIYQLSFLALPPIFSLRLYFSCYPQPTLFLALTSHMCAFFNFYLSFAFIFFCHFHFCWTFFFFFKGFSPHLILLYLLAEGTVTAPAGHLAVVKAAQTVTWSAWSLGPGAVQIQTAPTAHSGHLSPRLAASLASPSLPEGIALEATKAPRVAAKALALVRTGQKESRYEFANIGACRLCEC